MVVLEFFGNICAYNGRLPAGETFPVARSIHCPALSRQASEGAAASYALESSDFCGLWQAHVKQQRSYSRRSVGTEAEAANLLPPTNVLDIWRSADAVCFDVDSTVCEDEGIDELAEFCGAGQAVAEWTTRAMTGSVKFEDALAARLDLFKPSAETLEKFLAQHPPRLSPGIVELVAKLHAKGKHVYLVSGGFRQMIEPAAALLGIPVARIFANRLLFASNGDFAGFDRSEPTSRSGGKAIATSKIKQENGYLQVVMMGDGATDLEARRPGGADLFIGYGGVQVRPKVAAEADWFVYDFEGLLEALD